MHSPIAMLKVIAKASLDAIGFGLAGDLAFDLLPAVAKDLHAWCRGKSADECRAELEALAQASPSEARQVAAEVAAEADAPDHVRRDLEIYLSLVPGAVRRSLRRPADPLGHSLPLGRALDSEDLFLSMLPRGLPRFAPGDRPLPGIDWELDELLGAGGFGEVWRARNPHFDGVPPVALKFCLDPSAKDRLLRHEASVLNQVMRQGRHPSIVTLKQTYLSADPPCLEYEYVAGGDLTGLLAEWSLLPGPERVARTQRLMRELAQAVGFAHRLTPPVVHRDLKPANILLEPVPGAEPRLRVADFGIGGLAAGHAIAQTNRVSQAGFLATALRGAHTPLYASPQQIRGGPPDPRDDVHALGVIWYQLLTGNLAASRPGGTSWTRRLAALGCTQSAIDLLGSCVEEEPEDRPADAAVLADRLTALVTPAPIKTPAPAPRSTGDGPRSLTNSIGLKLTLIRPGSFVMGSTEPLAQDDERPARLVTLTQPFYLGVYPVTQLEYEAVLGRNPAYFTRANGGGPRHPVEQLTWAEAEEFCRALSRLPSERSAGRRYELPTEAEWEYAGRAGTTTAFSSGDSLRPDQANFDTSRPLGPVPARPALGKTSPVGQYAANPWGLHDLHGNVWEWCRDWYAADAYAVAGDTDPTGPPKGRLKVLRGGSWNNSGHLCRSARRNKHAPDFRSDTIGVRVKMVMG